MSTGKVMTALLLGALIVVGYQTTVYAETPHSTGQSWLQLDKAMGNGFQGLEYESVIRGQDDGSCCDDLCCDDQGCADYDCCGGCCLPRWRVYGDFLYMRPRNAEVAYALPINGETGATGTPVPIGRIATVDPGYNATFRVGIDRYLDACSSIGVSYTQLFADDADSISIDAPDGVIRSLVNHPQNAAADWQVGEAQYEISYKLVDLDYRRVFLCGPRHQVAYVAGLRYGHLEQDFHSQFSITGNESVDSRVAFDGGGIRFGLEGERQAPCSGFLVYGRANASFVAGEFRGDYADTGSLDIEIANAQWKAARIVPMLDLELGVGWTNQSGRLRMTAGYVVTAWYNTITTADFIDAVQNSGQTPVSNPVSVQNIGGLSNKLLFDGLVVRTELRY